MVSRKRNRGHREANDRPTLTRGWLKELESRNACARRQTNEKAASFRGRFLAVVPHGNNRTFPGWHSNGFITRNRQYLRLVHVRDNVRRLERNANPPNSCWPLRIRRWIVHRFFFYHLWFPFKLYMVNDQRISPSKRCVNSCESSIVNTCNIDTNIPMRN